MEMVIYVVVNIVYYLLVLTQLLMLVRAIASWIVQDDDTPFMRFLYLATEPFIIPFRKLLERFESLRDFPLDIPFLAAVLAISLLQMLLPTSIVF